MEVLSEVQTGNPPDQAAGAELSRELHTEPTAMKTTLPFEYWAVGRGSYWLQSRSQAVSSYLRTLKCLRKVGYAVIGDHITLWAFDGTERKLRAIIRGLDREFPTLFASHGIQAQAPRAVLLP